MDKGLFWWLSNKESGCNTEDTSSIPGSGRSLEKGMAAHSSILAWEIRWTEEPGMLQFSSFQFSRSVMSDSLRPHELQHTRPPCPSPTPTVHPNPCPLSRWYHPTISSSVIPFSSWPQSFLTSVSFQMSQLFTSGGQSIGSFRFDISPSNKHPGLISFRMDWLDLLAVQRTLKSLLQHHSSKASILQRSAFFIVQLSIHTWPLENHSLD